MHRIFDLHSDTVHKIAETGLRSCPDAHVDLVRMKEAGYGMAALAAFVDAGRTDDPYGDCLSYLDRIRTETEKNGDIARLITSLEDLTATARDGKVGIMLTVEEGGVIEEDIGRVRELAERGVRIMTFTWNYDNDISGCSHVSNDRGLSEFGCEFLGTLEESHIIADVSHLSDAGFYDVAKLAKRPFIASHSNARAVCAHGRNLTDDMIRIIGSRGGIIGLNYCAYFVGGDGGLSMLCRHAREIADCGGVGTVALGGDLDGIPTNPAIKDCTEVPALWDALHKFGFTPSECDSIMGGNAERFFSEMLD